MYGSFWIAAPFLFFSNIEAAKAMSEKKKKRERKTRKGAGNPASTEVQLAPIIQFLHENLSESLCELVFREVRDAERERKWSLFALARFWTAVVLNAPPSLTQFLEQAGRRDPLGLLPYVEASSESFFQKCKGMPSEFFMALYTHVVEKVLPTAPERYARKFAGLRKRFPKIEIIDASRLDKIAHRLKILWNEEAAVLPGCVTAVYDLFRGFATEIWFDPDAADSEFNRAVEILAGLTEGSLVLGDRLYCSLQLFKILRENHSFGLFRRNRTISFQKVRLLWKGDVNGAEVEDWLILAGAGEKKEELRLVVLRKKNGETYEAMTNDLDPEHLSAKDIVQLYPWRWKIERLFFDLKEVLNLNKFYAANPNAVAMQVYATAILHVAFRIAQADVAEQASIEPEEISPKKLFPRLALVSIAILESEYGAEEVIRLNPGVKLRRPNFRNHPRGRVRLASILVQKRSGERKKKTFSEGRKKWTSFNNIAGGEQLT
jgi:hypothetical protein